MAFRAVALALVISSPLLVAVVAQGAPKSLTVLLEDTIQFQDGSGTSIEAISPGETAVFYIRDADLASVATSTGTWTAVNSAVPPNSWWSLANGAPDPGVYALSAGSGYDTAVPSRTPLFSKPSAYFDDVPQGVGDFRPDTGEVQIAFGINAGSTARIEFDFHVDVADRYAAAEHRARVASDSDSAGEWVSLTEVTGESNPEESPTSGLFRGGAELTGNEAAMGTGDGAVRVRLGDILTATYYESDGETIVDTHQVQVVAATPAPTPVPMVGPLALMAAAALLALVRTARGAARPARFGTRRGER